MTKPELGVKRDCPNCGARFYDLNKEPAHCPKCEHEFVPEALLKPRKPRREDEPAEKDEPAARTETSLEAADKEAKPAKSKRKPALDDENAESDDENVDDLEDIEDIDVDMDDEDDDSLLEDDDEDSDVSGIVTTGENDDD